MLVGLSSLLACGSLLGGRSFEVGVRLDGQRHALTVNENQSILSAVERAGLLPTSDCRRGRCLSCAARVTAGAPFSLRVAGDTALCDLAHASGLVLLCSAYPTGTGLEIELDAEAEAYQIQHQTRWRSPPPQTPSMGRKPVQFRLEVAGASLLERSFSQPASSRSDSDDAATNETSTEAQGSSGTAGAAEHTESTEPPEDAD